MLLIHGKYISREPLGFVGHFCPICRDLAPFIAVRARMVEHAYFIPLGKGKELCDELTCQTCTTVISVTSGSVHAGAEHAGEDLIAFAAETSPDLPAVEDRLALESRLLANELTPQERSQLLEEPFVVLEFMAQRGRADGNDVRTAGSFVAWGLSVAIVIVLWLQYLNLARPSNAFLSGLYVASAAAGLLTIWLFYAAATNRPTRMIDQVSSRIAVALAPLNPSNDEIKQILQGLRKSKSAVGKAVSVDDIVEKMRSDQRTASGESRSA